jgi:hypothetical protein
MIEKEKKLELDDSCQKAESARKIIGRRLHVYIHKRGPIFQNKEAP